VAPGFKALILLYCEPTPCDVACAFHILVSPDCGGLLRNCSAHHGDDNRQPPSEAIRPCVATLHKLVPEATVPGAFDFADPEDCSATLGLAFHCKEED
jgi:hypothetical protein